jgi:hypothetical protein
MVKDLQATGIAMTTFDRDEHENRPRQLGNKGSQLSANLSPPSCEGVSAETRDSSHGQF